MITIQALYLTWEAADNLVENLLDDGFAQKDILLTSRHYWVEGFYRNSGQISKLQGREVMVQVRGLNILQARIIKDRMLDTHLLAIREYVEVPAGQLTGSVFRQTGLFISF
jgi:hypothetical protein